MVLPPGMRIVPLGVLLLAASACGSAQDQPVGQTAGQFYSAVADGDGRVACHLLAPDTLVELEQSAQKPCAEALVEEDLPAVRDRGRVRAFGTMAQVRYDGETVFLTRFADGWKIMAAGCTPTAPERYDCQVQGG